MQVQWRRRFFLVWCLGVLLSQPAFVRAQAGPVGSEDPAGAADPAAPPVLGPDQHGAMLLSQGQWAEAIKELTRAVSREPNRSDLHANLGMAHYFKGDSAAAVPEFQTAVKLDRERPDALHGLGLALYERGDFAAAADAFRASSQQNSAAFYNLGNALEHQGDRDGASAAYARYLAAAPPSPETVALGDALQQRTFPTPAAGTAQEHFRRGQARLDEKDGVKAIVAFLAALRLKPNYVEASNGLGLAFRAAGNLDEAIAAYQTAIRLNIRYSPAYRNLAQAFEEKGDRAAAAQGYARYLLITPGATDAAEIRERIERLRSGQ
ncbi:MAG: tetratricopeptide repeat protein [Deltaproteobacteria bacterium]|nr:tetratricopeptide repeat protein [Deltaproteobacteria bacterium]